MVSRRTRRPRLLAGIAAALVLLVVGIWLGGHPGWMPSSLRSAFVSQGNGQLVDQVLGMLSREYYRPINRGQLTNKGLAAMVASLDDPYSHYYDPTAYR